MFYKATYTDGRDFFSGCVDYADALKCGAPLPEKPHCAHPAVPSSAVYTAADKPTEIGCVQWPCRLFEVDGNPVGTDGRGTFGFFTLRVVREVDPWQLFGPQGLAVCAMLARAESLSWDELLHLGQFWEGQLRGDGPRDQYVLWSRYMNDARNTARLFHRGSAFRTSWTAARMAVDTCRVRAVAARERAGLDVPDELLRYLGYAAEVVAAAVSGQLLADLLLPTETEWLGRAWESMIATAT